MDAMTQRERDVLEESFALYDTVGDSKIHVSLLGEALRGLGLNPTEGEIRKIVMEIDSTGSTRISFEEFLPIYQSLSSKKRKASAEDFLECFRVYDKEGDGTISAGELHHVITTLGEALSPQQVELLTQGLEDKKGRIDIEEFVRTVMEG